MPEIVHDERPTLVLNRTFKTGRAELATVLYARPTAEGIWTKAADR